MTTGYATNAELHSPSCPESSCSIYVTNYVTSFIFSEMFHFYGSVPLRPVTFMLSNTILSLQPLALTPRSLSEFIYLFPVSPITVISLSWNKDLNEGTLWTRHYPNHRFDGYFAASITHSLSLRLFYFRSLKWRDWLYSPVLREFSSGCCDTQDCKQYELLSRARRLIQTGSSSTGLPWGVHWPGLAFTSKAWLSELQGRI